MDDTMALIWLVLVIVFSAVEAVNPQLVSLWFAGGAIASLIFALFGAPLFAQIVVFVVVSTILLIATRPLVKKFLNVKIIKTNSDANIGKTGIVTILIDNQKGVGQVKVSGQIWSARSIDDSIIAEGVSVTVERIDGVKLVVKLV